MGKSWTALREAWTAFFSAFDAPEPEPELMEVDDLDFSTALWNLDEGYKVARAGWRENGADIYIVEVASDHPVYTGWQINLVTLGGKSVPWIPTQRDILADDWMLVEEDDEGW